MERKHLSPNQRVIFSKRTITKRKEKKRQVKPTSLASFLAAAISTSSLALPLSLEIFINSELHEPARQARSERWLIFGLAARFHFKSISSSIRFVIASRWMLHRTERTNESPSARSRFGKQEQEAFKSNIYKQIIMFASSEWAREVIGRLEWKHNQFCSLITRCGLISTVQVETFRSVGRSNGFVLASQQTSDPIRFERSVFN